MAVRLAIPTLYLGDALGIDLELFTDTAMDVPVPDLDERTWVSSVSVTPGATVLLSTAGVVVGDVVSFDFTATDIEDDLGVGTFSLDLFDVTNKTRIAIGRLSIEHGVTAP